MKLNLGCGSVVPDGWMNVDYALGARYMKIPFFRAINKKVKIFNLDWNEKIFLHDLTNKFPWADSSADVVYSSHTLEHFSKQDGRNFLSECHRILRKNGIIRIVVPDLHYDVIEYVEGRTKADDFVEKLGVHGVDNKSKLKNVLSKVYSFPHKCMYDHNRLGEILDEIGFQSSARRAFDSDVEEIRLIELKDRTENAVIVEGRKK
jgi:predicted SAM-dependent methyltransferase